MSLSFAGRQVDFRVACQPTVWGENVVVRILDRVQGLLALDALGLDAVDLHTLQQMLQRPDGLLLVTGPTGSGKTTTLYALLGEINSVGVNIMTLEDPVEYPLPLLRQTGIADNIKMGFADGIRAMLRQDPDILLVGEIRDRDTADMALRAALTGHQVFSTLHCNSAAGAIPRLLDLGIAPDLLAGNLTGIVAQRLVRALCPHCATQTPARAAEAQMLDVPEQTLLPRPVGCPACRHQGYRGRFALMEILQMNAGLDELLAGRASRQTLEKYALERGMRTLAQRARQAILEGRTSLEAMLRVVDLASGSRT